MLSFLVGKKTTDTVSTQVLIQDSTQKDAKESSSGSTQKPIPEPTPVSTQKSLLESAQKSTPESAQGSTSESAQKSTPGAVPEGTSNVYTGGIRGHKKKKFRSIKKKSKDEEQKRQEQLNQQLQTLDNLTNKVLKIEANKEKSKQLDSQAIVLNTEEVIEEAKKDMEERNKAQQLEINKAKRELARVKKQQEKQPEKEIKKIKPQVEEPPKPVLRTPQIVELKTKGKHIIYTFDFPNELFKSINEIQKNAIKKLEEEKKSLEKFQSNGLIDEKSTGKFDELLEFSKVLYVDILLKSQPIFVQDNKGKARESSHEYSETIRYDFIASANAFLKKNNLNDHSLLNCINAYFDYIKFYSKLQKIQQNYSLQVAKFSEPSKGNPGEEAKLVEEAKTKITKSFSIDRSAATAMTESFETLNSAIQIFNEEITNKKCEELKTIDDLIAAEIRLQEQEVSLSNERARLSERIKKLDEEKATLIDSYKTSFEPASSEVKNEIDLTLTETEIVLRIKHLCEFENRRKELKSSEVNAFAQSLHEYQNYIGSLEYQDLLEKVSLALGNAQADLYDLGINVENLKNKLEKAKEAQLEAYDQRYKELSIQRKMEKDGLNSDLAQRNAIPLNVYTGMISLMKDEYATQSSGIYANHLMHYHREIDALEAENKDNVSGEVSLAEQTKEKALKLKEEIYSFFDDQVIYLSKFNNENKLNLERITILDEYRKKFVKEHEIPNLNPLLEKLQEKIIKSSMDQKHIPGNTALGTTATAVTTTTTTSSVAATLNISQSKPNQSVLQSVASASAEVSTPQPLSSAPTQSASLSFLRSALIIGGNVLLGATIAAAFTIFTILSGGIFGVLAGVSLTIGIIGTSAGIGAGAVGAGYGFLGIGHMLGLLTNGKKPTPPAPPLAKGTANPTSNQKPEALVSSIQKASSVSHAVSKSTDATITSITGVPPQNTSLSRSRSNSHPGSLTQNKVSSSDSDQSPRLRGLPASCSDPTKQHAAITSHIPRSKIKRGMLSPLTPTFINSNLQQGTISAGGSPEDKSIPIQGNRRHSC